MFLEVRPLVLNVHPHEDRWEGVRSYLTHINGISSQKPGTKHNISVFTNLPSSNPRRIIWQTTDSNKVGMTVKPLERESLTLWENGWRQGYGVFWQPVILESTFMIPFWRQVTVLTVNQEKVPQSDSIKNLFVFSPFTTSSCKSWDEPQSVNKFSRRLRSHFTIFSCAYIFCSSWFFSQWTGFETIWTHFDTCAHSFFHWHPWEWKKMYSQSNTNLRSTSRFHVTFHISRFSLTHVKPSIICRHFWHFHISTRQALTSVSL